MVFGTLFRTCSISSTHLHVTTTTEYCLCKYADIKFYGRHESARGVRRAICVLRWKKTIWAAGRSRGLETTEMGDVYGIERLRQSPMVCEKRRHLTGSKWTPNLLIFADVQCVVLYLKSTPSVTNTYFFKSTFFGWCLKKKKNLLRSLFIAYNVICLRVSNRKHDKYNNLYFKTIFCWNVWCTNVNCYEGSHVVITCW